MRLVFMALGWMLIQSCLGADAAIEKEWQVMDSVAKLATGLRGLPIETRVSVVSRFMRQNENFVSVSVGQFGIVSGQFRSGRIYVIHVMIGMLEPRRVEQPLSYFNLQSWQTPPIDSKSTLPINKVNIYEDMPEPIFVKPKVAIWHTRGYDDDQIAKELILFGANASAMQMSIENLLKSNEYNIQIFEGGGGLLPLLSGEDSFCMLLSDIASTKRTEELKTFFLPRKKGALPEVIVVDSVYVGDSEILRVRPRRNYMITPEFVRRNWSFVPNTLVVCERLFSANEKFVEALKVANVGAVVLGRNQQAAWFTNYALEILLGYRKYSGNPIDIPVSIWQVRKAPTGSYLEPNPSLETIEMYTPFAEVYSKKNWRYAPALYYVDVLSSSRFALHGDFGKLVPQSEPVVMRSNRRCKLVSVTSSLIIAETDGQPLDDSDYIYVSIGGIPSNVRCLTSAQVRLGYKLYNYSLDVEVDFRLNLLGDFSPYKLPRGQDRIYGSRNLQVQSTSNCTVDGQFYELALNQLTHSYFPRQYNVDVNTTSLGDGEFSVNVAIRNDVLVIELFPNFMIPWSYGGSDLQMVLFDPGKVGSNTRVIRFLLNSTSPSLSPVGGESNSHPYAKVLSVRGDINIARPNFELGQKMRLGGLR